MELAAFIESYQERRGKLPGFRKVKDEASNLLKGLGEMYTRARISDVALRRFLTIHCPQYREIWDSWIEAEAERAANRQLEREIEQRAAQFELNLQGT